MNYLVYSVMALASVLAPYTDAQQQPPSQTTNGPCSPIFNGTGNVQNCIIVTDQGTLKAVQSGNTVTISAVGGRVEPVSFGLIFDTNVSFVSHDLPFCMICGTSVLATPDGAPNMKSIALYWQSPALLPNSPVTITFKSDTPAKLLQFVAVPMPRHL